MTGSDDCMVDLEAGERISMMLYIRLCVLVVIPCLLSGCAGTGTDKYSANSHKARLIVPQVFGSNMMLQRDRPLPVWGRAEPCSPVTVRFRDCVVNGKSDRYGVWKVNLPPQKAGGPDNLVITSLTSITFTNVLVGEVWLASGQSNMEFAMGRVTNSAAEIARANFPGLRFGIVARCAAGEPVEDVQCDWVECSSNTAPRVSAVAYYYAEELHRRLNVPVGVIVSAWGGTPVETWTPAEAFATESSLTTIDSEVRSARDAYQKEVAAGMDQIESWVVEARRRSDSGEGLRVPHLPSHKLASQLKPTGLYNGMIAPLVPFAIRGVIWYQGESNTWEVPGLYRYKIRALINAWRKAWAQGDFSFYSVQLAPFRYSTLGQKDPTMLCRLWESQTDSLSVTNTGLAVITDVTMLNDIHPVDKMPVGRRLALWALAKDYGFTNLVYSGPLFRCATVEKGRVVVRFDHAGGGLVSRDGNPLSWWEVAGEDHQFKPASAVIEGDTVVVTSPDVQQPLSVHFGWSEEAQPNLMNREGLPASPFRSIRDEQGWIDASRAAKAFKAQ